MIRRRWCEGDDTKLLLHYVKGMILNYCSVCLSVCLSVSMSVIASKREVSTQIYISVDNVEHTTKLDISISDAVVTQTIANVQRANVRQAKCI